MSMTLSSKMKVRTAWKSSRSFDLVMRSNVYPLPNKGIVQRYMITDNVTATNASMFYMITVFRCNV